MNGHDGMQSAGGIYSTEGLGPPAKIKKCLRRNYQVRIKGLNMQVKGKEQRAACDLNLNRGSTLRVCGRTRPSRASKPGSCSLGVMLAFGPERSGHDHTAIEGLWSEDAA